VLRNDLPGPGTHFLKLRVRGTPDGVGARVELVSGGKRQLRSVRRSRGYLSASEPVLVFGLGVHSKVERLVVTWPSGRQRTLTNLSANQTLTVEEPPGD
jgi:hypothetical protein